MQLHFMTLVAALIAVGSSAAGAQEFNDPNSFAVNANFNIQMPLDKKAQTSDLAKAISQMTQQLSDLANRECDVLSDAFKSECQVVQLNFGTNVNERRNRRFNGGDEGEQQKVVSANVQATFKLTPRAADAKPTPPAADAKPTPAPTSTP